MLNRRSLLRGFFAIALAPQLPLLAAPGAKAVDFIVLDELVQNDPWSFGQVVRWLVRCNGRNVVAMAVIDDWNNLELRDQARALLRSQVIEFIKATT